MEKLLPQNLEAEMGVLGSIILDPEAIIQVADFLHPGDFYRDAHHDIYEAIRHLYQEREPADFITICDELERHNALEKVGGPGYITSLVNQVPTSGNVEYYGRIVERTSILRRIISAAGHMASNAYDSNDADKTLDNAEQLLFAIRQARNVRHGLVDLDTIIAACMTDIDQAYQHQEQLIGIPTGFRELDELLGGGLQKTDLILIAGRPGMGKTALALNIAHYAAVKKHKRTAVFSLEMGAKALGYRLLSHETGIPTQRMRNGWMGDDELQRLVLAQYRLDAAPLSIDDTAGSPVLAIRNELRKLQSEKHEPVELVVVDYLQLMEAAETDGQRRRENRVQEIDTISHGLKQIAKDFDVPVLAMAQLSRKVEERQVKIPQLSDLRESGSLEMDADVVLFTYRDDYYAGKDEHGVSKSGQPNIADILIAKHRNGDTGEIKLYWHGKTTRFFNSKAECEGAYAAQE